MSKAAHEQSTVIEGYNAVAEVRKTRDQLAEAMKDMSPEEQVAYIRERASRFRQKHLQKQKGEH